MEDPGQKRQVGHTPQSTWQQVTRAQLAVSAEQWLSRAGCLGWEMTDAGDSGTSASTWFPCCLQSLLAPVMGAHLYVRPYSFCS